MSDVDVQRYLLFGIYKEVENYSDLNVVVNKLSIFSMSDLFPIYCSCKYGSEGPFFDIVSIFEMKESFLSLKIIFPLLEELKQKNFKNKIEELLKNCENSKYCENLVNSYICSNRESINEFEKSKKRKNIIL